MCSLHLVCTSVLLFISHRADIFPRVVGAGPDGGGLALRLRKQQQTKTDPHHINIISTSLQKITAKNHKIIILHNVISYVVAEKGQPNLKKMTRGWLVTGAEAVTPIPS